MPRPAILTEEVLAGIPALIEQGLRKSDIAELLGCKASTLQVKCSVAGISLRGTKRKCLQLETGLELSEEALAGLRARAAGMGRTEAQLARELLEVIVRDNLYSAVLDLAPLQPELTQPQPAAA